MNDKTYKSLFKFLCFGFLYFLVSNDLLIKINVLPRNILSLFGIYQDIQFGIFTDVFCMFIEILLALVTLIYGIICLLRLYDFKFIKKN